MFLSSFIDLLHGKGFLCRALEAEKQMDIRGRPLFGFGFIHQTYRLGCNLSLPYCLIVAIWFFPIKKMDLLAHFGWANPPGSGALVSKKRSFYRKSLFPICLELDGGTLLSSRGVQPFTW
jgi:hypothetical protein